MNSLNIHTNIIIFISEKNTLKHRLNKFKSALNYSFTIIFTTMALPASAHFLELIPDRDVLNSDNQQALNFSLRFTHPMDQGPIMDLVRPKALSVSTLNTKTDLLSSLQLDGTVDSKQYTFEYQVTEPADLVFYVEPEPYWEPSEGKMIIHYTKVIVDGYSVLNGWDQLVGAPVEIEPLTRPYSLLVGNAFQGIVKKHGKAVPFATVEVEWRNDGSVTESRTSYITQVIKADANGTFSYVMPRAGWWGFAALLDADYQLPSPNSEQAPVELGGLIWINAKDL